MTNYQAILVAIFSALFGTYLFFTRPIKQEPEQPVKVEKKKDEEVDVNDPFYRGPRPDPFKPGIKIALAPRPERGFYFKLLDSKPILQVWNRCW